MTNPDYTHLAFVVDRSASMRPIATEMDQAIKNVLEDQSSQPGELHVDVWTFDDSVEHRYQDVRPDDVKGELVVPRGNTALNDAIARAVTELGERFAAQAEDDRPSKVVLVIVTDGEENASKELPGTAGREEVKKMVERQKEQYQWEVLFFGATSIDAFDAADGYGIGRGQTLSFAPSGAGVVNSSLAASQYVTRTRSGVEDNAFTDDEREGALQE